MDKNKLGTTLKRLRIKKGWTQEELAKELNRASSTIGLWEQGRREMDYDSLITLADIFDVSVDFLLGRVEHEKEIKGSEKLLIDLDEYQFALFGEVKDLTEEQKKDLLKIIKILKKHDIN